MGNGLRQNISEKRKIRSVAVLKYFWFQKKNPFFNFLPQSNPLIIICQKSPGLGGIQGLERLGGIQGLEGQGGHPRVGGARVGHTRLEGHEEMTMNVVVILFHLEIISFFLSS